MIAVADVQVVVDIVLRDVKLARAVIDSVVAKMIDLVAREERLVGGQPRAQPDIVN